MRLEPRYGDRPALRVDLPALEGPHPVLRQRQRLQAHLEAMPEDAWQHPSRCEGWSAQDVITHLVSTNQFWDVSIQQGLAGAPTRFLATFDPVATPAELVAERGKVPPAETLVAFVDSNRSLLATVEALEDAHHEVLAEAPPGHLPVRHVLDHALWDAWVHERDILLPQGKAAVEDAAEVLTCLRYAAALGRAVSLAAGTGAGSAEITATAPAERLVVEVHDDQVRVHDGPAPADARRLDGPAVELVEMLSRRDVGRPHPEAAEWLTAGLAQVFDQTASA